MQLKSLMGLLEGQIKLVVIHEHKDDNRTRDVIYEGHLSYQYAHYEVENIAPITIATTNAFGVSVKALLEIRVVQEVD